MIAVAPDQQRHLHEPLGLANTHIKTVETAMNRDDTKTDDIIPFGEALLRTNDLDPGYCAIHGAELPREVTGQQISVLPDATFVQTERRNVTGINGAADSDRASQVGRRAPPIPDPAVSTDPVVLAGRAALQRRIAAERERLLDEPRMWPDYAEVGAALMVGRAWAMAEAHTNKPSGKLYTRKYGHWLQANQLHDQYRWDKDHRSKLLSLMEELPQVEAWRASLEEKKRANLNHPYNVWKAWRAWKKQQAEAARSAEEAADRALPSAALPSPEAVSDPEAASDPKPEASLRKPEEGRLLVEATKLIGIAKDFRNFSGENATFVRTARELATEWAQTAALLEERQRQREQRAA